MVEDIDLIKSVFEHRLRQADLDRILTALSVTDRDELLTKMGDLLRHISALVQVSAKVSDTLALDVLLPRLMEIVTDALSADRSTLFLYDEESDELFSRVLQGDVMGEIRFPSGMGIAGSVFKTGKPVIIHDAYADARFNQEVDRKTGYRTRNILCTAVRNKNKVIGVTQVLNKHEGDFDREDLTLLDALTSQAGSALENARLYERVEKARKEEAQLLEVTNVIASELQLDTLLAKVIQAATLILDADRSTLFMYDPDSHELWSRIAQGLEVKEIRFPAGSGIAGSCFISGEVINIPDAYQDPRFNQAVDRKTGYRTRSILCMPVFNKNGDKLAVIQVLNKRGAAFSALDERRLRAFSAQVAIALENARLFEDVLNERNYNESILRSLSNGVLTLDTARRVSKANQSALKILGWSGTEVLGRPLDELLPYDDEQWIQESLDKVDQSGQVDLALDMEIRRSDGAPVSVNSTVVPLIDTKEQAIGSMLILEDITSEKRVKSTMARYMTKELADRLLESGEDALGGASQEATVLFSDIRSFTTLAEELGPRETVAMLNDYFTEMVDVVFRHGGILDKYIGDAIMALFGTPFPEPDDAAHSLEVANEMITVLRDFNRRRSQAGKPTIRIGVGVSTGELVAGNIGSPKRMDYTVIGDTVNLAARLESATKYYGVPILLSESTVAHLNGKHLHREIDLIRVKGKNHPAAIYEALGHHTEETFPNMQWTLEAFSRGLRRYRDRNWHGAMQAFEEALNSTQGDYPSRLYLDRCRHYLDYPPPEDWGGVWTMASK